MQAVLLAAGRGTRMGPLTASRPKALLPIGNRPLVAWQLERLANAGIDEVLLVVHHEAAQVARWIRRDGPKKPAVRLVRQAKALGTGDALVAARRRLDDEFLLLHADTIVAVDDLKRFVQRNGVLVGAADVADARPFGALRLRGTRVQKIVEKSPRPPSRRINAGLYRLPRRVADAAARVGPSRRGERELTDAVNVLAASEPVRAVRLAQWIDVGRPWDLLTAQERLLPGIGRRIEGRVERGANLQGDVVIGPGSVVRSGTMIEGPVVVGRDCRIGPNAYVRGATSLGDGCHIGASVEVKNSIVMERTNIPHLSYVGDSILGSDVNLGAGTNIANLKVTSTNVRVRWEGREWIDTGRRKFGAVIGDGSKLGINCSLNPGTVLGRECLVGTGKSLTGWAPDRFRVL